MGSLVEACNETLSHCRNQIDNYGHKQAAEPRELGNQFHHLPNQRVNEEASLRYITSYLLVLFFLSSKNQKLECMFLKGIAVAHSSNCNKNSAMNSVAMAGIMTDTMVLASLLIEYVQNKRTKGKEEGDLI